MAEQPRKFGHSIQLDDGTMWPDPYLDYRELDEPQRTFHIHAVIEAYGHLAAHPAGTESCVKSLRALRRAVKVAR